MKISIKNIRNYIFKYQNYKKLKFSKNFNVKVIQLNIKNLNRRQ